MSFSTAKRHFETARTMIWRASILAVALVWPTAAGAMDFGEYAANLQTDPGRATLRAYLGGFGSAIGMYEVRQAMDGRGRRFCMPQGTPLVPELLAGLIDRTVKEQPNLANKDIPVEAIIWVGLERTFPCKNKTG